MANNYDGLRDYLDNRFADAMVLTFAQVEALLGFPLPDAARVDRSWWGNEPTGASSQPHTRAWTTGRRTATPNLGAQSVRFERMP